MVLILLLCSGIVLQKRTKSTLHAAYKKYDIIALSIAGVALPPAIAWEVLSSKAPGFGVLLGLEGFGLIT